MIPTKPIDADTALLAARPHSRAAEALKAIQQYTTYEADWDLEGADPIDQGAAALAARVVEWVDLPMLGRNETMPRTQYTKDEIARIAEAMYRRDIRDKVMPKHKGQFLTLDIESGDYEIDDDDLSGEKRLRALHPDGAFFGFRIGYKAAYALSGGLEEDAA